jgi:hypothetical protein
MNENISEQGGIMFTKCCVAVGSVVSLMCVLTESSIAKEPEAPAVLVIPARPAIVKLAFDIAGLRKSTALICYQIVQGSASPAVSIWDARGQDWVKTSLNDYASGGIFDPVPQQAILVGTDSDILAVIERSSSWSKKVIRVPSLNIMNVVNALDEALTFSPEEWTYLARTYDLKLQDQNAERRRYGKYGKPGSKREPVMPKKEDVQKARLPLVIPADDVTTKSGAVKQEVKSGTADILPEDK